MKKHPLMTKCLRKYNTATDVLKVVRGVLQFDKFEEAGVIPSVHDRGFFGDTPLAVVTTWEDSEAALLLLQAGADVNAKVEDGDTVLHRAVRSNNHELTRLYLSYEASKDEVNDAGHTPYNIALIMRHDDLVKLLAPPDVGIVEG